MDHTAGTRVCCPLCNTAVIMTSTGLGGLPGSLFLRKLVKLKEIFGSELARSCDLCNGSESYKIGGTLVSRKTSNRCFDSNYLYRGGTRIVGDRR